MHNEHLVKVVKGIQVVSYNLVEEPGQIKEPKQILLVQFEFNLIQTYIYFGLI